MGCCCCKRKPLTPDSTPKGTPTKSESTPSPPPPRIGFLIEPGDPITYESLPDAPRLPEKVGWNVDAAEDLSYTMLVDPKHGMDIINKIKRNPKLGLLLNDSYAEVYKTKYKGQEKVAIVFKHDFNESIKIDTALKDFYNAQFRNKKDAHVNLAMDPGAPCLKYKEYNRRRGEFEHHKIQNFFFSASEQDTDADKYRSYTRSINPKYFESWPGHIKVPATSKYDDLPSGPFRRPGWWSKEGHPYYIFLIAKEDGIRLLRRLCTYPTSGHLIENCKGEMFRCIFNGSQMLGLSITHASGGIKTIDKCARALHRQGFPEVMTFRICCDVDTEICGYNKEYCVNELARNHVNVSNVRTNLEPHEQPEQPEDNDGSEQKNGTESVEMTNNANTATLRNNQSFMERLRNKWRKRKYKYE